VKTLDCPDVSACAGVDDAGRSASAARRNATIRGMSGIALGVAANTYNHPWLLPHPVTAHCGWVSLVSLGNVHDLGELAEDRWQARRPTHPIGGHVTRPVFSRRCLRVIKGHKGRIFAQAVNAVAFSPDGRLLASGGDDQKVRRLCRYRRGGWRRRSGQRQVRAV
jgi:WD domain, G-beta repeat